MSDMNNFSIETSRIKNYESIKDMARSLLCIICQSLPMHPLQCRGCNVICCKECYEEWGKPTKCPLNCEKPKYKEPLIITKRFFSELKISCLYQDKGCEEIMLFDQLEAHENNCLFRTRKCPKYKHCGKEPLLKDLTSHIQECGYMKVECEFCGERIRRSGLCAHLEIECPFYLVKCKHCNGKIERRKHANHEKKCDEREIQCKDCKLALKKKEEPSHSCVQHLLKLVTALQIENQEIKQKLNKTEESNQMNSYLCKELKEELQAMKQSMQKIQQQLDSKIEAENHSGEKLYLNDLSQLRSNKTEFLIIAAHSGKAIELAEETKHNFQGGKIQQNTLNNRDNQLWNNHYLKDQFGGALVYFRNFLSRGVMSVDANCGNKDTQGAQVKQCDMKSVFKSYEQQWVIKQAPGWEKGFWQIVNYKYGKVLDVFAVSLADGEKVQIWAEEMTPETKQTGNQVFRFRCRK